MPCNLILTLTSNALQSLEMTSRVNHEPSVRESWSIVGDIDKTGVDRVTQRREIVLNDLGEALEA